MGHPPYKRAPPYIRAPYNRVLNRVPTGVGKVGKIRVGKGWERLGELIFDEKNWERLGKLAKGHFKV